MDDLRVGFGKCEITPALGCYLQGHNKVRIAQSVADPLHVRCVVFENNSMAALLYFDLIGIKQELAEEIREYVAQSIGCQRKDVFVSCTHTHYGPNMHAAYPKDEAYKKSLMYNAAQAARNAKNDLHGAKFLFAKDELPGITFVRRYEMKDGTFRTNPGRRNPDILRPASKADEAIQLLRIVREGAGDILLVGFQCHADVCKEIDGKFAISADYPGMVCDTLEKALPGVQCMYCNGAAGDLNHVDVNCPEWDENSGYDHAKHMGRTIAGKVLSMYTKARPVQSGSVRTAEKVISIPVIKPTEEQLERSRQILALAEKNGRETVKTTDLYEARTLCGASKLNGSYEVRVTAMSVGGFAVAGIPGEPFCKIGMDIREASPFEAQFVFGLTNGCEGYLPTREAFGVSGYESRTSKFLPGVGEIMAETGAELVKALYNDGI